MNEPGDTSNPFEAKERETSELAKTVNQDLIQVYDQITSVLIRMGLLGLNPWQTPFY